MSAARTILLTRPRTESEKLAVEVRARGFEAFIEPMLDIVPLDAPPPDLKKFQALVFTSANGVDAFCHLSAVRDIPVFTAGDATAARAAESGFSCISSSGGDLAILNQILAQAALKPGIPVLHVAGEHTAGDIVIADVPVERLVAYRADRTPAFTTECLRLIDKRAITAALFYSPRTALNFTELIHRCGRESGISAIKALCISEAVVKCLDHLPWQDVQAAPAPTRNGMMRLLDGLADDRGKTTTGGIA